MNISLDETRLSTSKFPNNQNFEDVFSPRPNVSTHDTTAADNDEGDGETYCSILPLSDHKNC